MLLEPIISLISPIRCEGCSVIGSGICDLCVHNRLAPLPSRCYKCHKATIQFQVCSSCRTKVKIEHVWVATTYSDLSKEILHKLKFERSSYLSKDIAKVIADLLPILPDKTVITYAPTAPKRVKIRGYDQSRLIAKQLSKELKLDLKTAFVRKTNSRQLGASKKQRYEQAKNSYQAKKSINLKNKNLLIIDDVVTSGATIEHLAIIAKENGAKSVSVAVFAQPVE